MTIRIFVDEDNSGSVSQISGTKEELAEIIKGYLNDDTVSVTIKKWNYDIKRDTHC